MAEPRIGRIRRRVWSPATAVQPAVIDTGIKVRLKIRPKQAGSSLPSLTSRTSRPPVSLGDLTPSSRGLAVIRPNQTLSLTVGDGLGQADTGGGCPVPVRLSKIPDGPVRGPLPEITGPLGLWPGLASSVQVGRYHGSPG